jgi:hypothetical protein
LANKKAARKKKPGRESISTTARLETKLGSDLEGARAPFVPLPMIDISDRARIRGGRIGLCEYGGKTSWKWYVLLTLDPKELRNPKMISPMLVKSVDIDCN